MPRFRKSLVHLFALLVATALSPIIKSGLGQRANDAAVEPRPYFTEPSLSPDRSEIAFVSGGDIWTAPASGGEARMLVSHTANESRPIYSPDGKLLAFVSNRTGGGDIYLLALAGGEARRLTFDDGVEQLDGWSRDGKWVYYSSTSQDIAGMNDIYRVSVEGGTPMQVSADRYVNEFASAPAPDGQSVAFSARGIASAQWWRNGHSHLDECEIWLMRGLSTSGYERLVERGAKSSRLRPKTAASRCALRAVWRVNRKSPGRLTAAASSTSRSATTRRICLCMTSRTTPKPGS